MCYMHCQYCIMPRYDLVAICLKASDTTIYICRLFVYDLYMLPISFFQRYAEEITLGTTAVYLVLIHVSIYTCL